MTPDLFDLGRRAVACPRWRWMSGMATTCGARIVRAYGPGGLTVLSADGASYVVDDVDSDELPDLSDPATRGCLLALVREAWGDPTLYVRLSDTYRATDKKAAWEVHGWLDASRSPDGRSGSWRGWGWASEAETLVATLENAP